MEMTTDDISEGDDCERNSIEIIVDDDDEEEIVGPSTSHWERDDSDKCKETSSQHRKRISSSSSNDQNVKKAKKNLDKEIDLKLIHFLERSEANQSSKEDEDELFCKSLACELRKIDDVVEKQRRKARMYLIATGLD